MRKKDTIVSAKCKSTIKLLIGLLDASLIKKHHNCFFIFSKRNIFKKKKERNRIRLIDPIVDPLFKLKKRECHNYH